MPLYARLWTDILDDPKLLRAARLGAKNLDKLPWLIAFAKRADSDGRLEISGEKAEPADIARSIPGATERQVRGCIEALLKLKVLVPDADGVPKFGSWDFRNSGKTSDSREAVAERVRKHRERRRSQRNAPGNGGNTLQALRGNEQESREKRVERREYRHTAGSTEKDSPSSPRSRSNRPQLPAAAREFGKRFYSTASRERQEDVRAQLVATLNGGATFRRGVKVPALSVERLEAKCREVIAEGVQDPDKAIVVLLTKLGDISDDSPTERAAASQRAEEQRDEIDVAQRLADAEAWLANDPVAAAAVAALVDPKLPEVSRRILRRSAVLKAWHDAGEPILETTAKSTGSP